MKITRVLTYPVDPGFGVGWLFVKIETDAEISGWGECLPDKAHIQAEAVRSFEQYLIGQDPRRITHHWQSMYRGSFWRGGAALTAAISGIEIALWDILGKSVGVPIWQLLGGAVRDRIRVYQHLRGNTNEELAANAKKQVASGYDAMKFCPLPKMRPIEGPRLVKEVVARVQAAREAVGDSVDIALDFHGRATPAMAIVLEEAMRPYSPLFIEEPVLPENVDALAQVAKQFKTPLATGERLFTKWGFREVLEKGAASILQPDPCVCGGIFETRQIGAMGEVYYAALAPHNPYGPINLAASLQIAAISPNFLIQELVDEDRLGGGCLVTPFVVENGSIALPTAPGLGVEVDEAFLAAHPLSLQQDHGRWLHESDGSVADW